MPQKCLNNFFQLGLLNISSIIINIIASNYVYAQNAITPDRTLGSETSQLSPVVNSTQNITGGAQRGSNLFHSFQEFNVGNGQSVFFVSPDNIENIVTRVTGNNISQILGTLGIRQTNINSVAANLFLINPNGIIFGQNSQLEISGSFLGSTASAIKLADGTLFSAVAPQTLPLLKISTPIGLQFDNRTTGSILFQGSFIEIPTGKTLALVGGNVSLEAGTVLIAESGQIAIGGVQGMGIVDVNLNTNNQPLSFPNNILLADISFKDTSFVDVSNFTTDGAGQIQIQGRKVSLTGGSRLTANTGNMDGRGIYIKAEDLTVAGGSQIETSTDGKGNGGSLIVNASNSVQVLGIDAGGKPSALFAETANRGNAGNLTIETSKLIVEDGANISTSTREGSDGKGGILTVNALDFVRVSGISAVFRELSSGLFTQTLGTGDAGSLNINTQRLIVQNGAAVTAGTGIDSGGKGGNLTVRATDSIQLSGVGANQSDSGLFVRSRGTGDAGSLDIITQRLTVRDNATATVENLGLGNAGNLDIDARVVRLENQGKITAATRLGQGGNISLRNLDLLLLRGNSQITTNADTSMVGTDVAGGNINIDSKLIVATPGANSDITANAFRGRGGNINIITNGLFGIEPRDRLTPQSDITATSVLGINGTIQINTPDVEPSRGIIALPEKFVDAAQSVVQSCSSTNKTTNEVVVTGRGGLPPSPDELLSNDVVWSDTRLNAITGQRQGSQIIANKPTSSQEQMKIVPATSWVFNQQGEVTLIAHAPNTPSYNLGNSSSCQHNGF